MEIPYPTDDEPATPEYVLAVLRDWQRLLSRLDPDVEPDVVLGFETTVAEWKSASNMGWGPIGRGLNRLWGIDVSDVEWRAALRPADKRSLGDLCGLIARQARVPRPRPLVALGAVSLPAGVFLAIRSALHNAGADVESLRPSSSLKCLNRLFLIELLWVSARLAPGALPAPAHDVPPEAGAGCHWILHGLGCIAAGLVNATAWLALAGLVVVCSSAAFVHWRAYHRNPSGVIFGELETFGDLATALALHSPRASVGLP